MILLRRYGSECSLNLRASKNRIRQRECSFLDLILQRGCSFGVPPSFLWLVDATSSDQQCSSCLFCALGRPCWLKQSFPSAMVPHFWRGLIDLLSLVRPWFLRTHQQVSYPDQQGQDPQDIPQTFRELRRELGRKSQAKQGIQSIAVQFP